MAARKEFPQVLEEVARAWVGYSHGEQRVSRDFRFCPWCRRGCDHHYWHFYRCSCLPQEADLALPVDRRRTVIGESDMIGWIPVSQVIAGRFQLTKPAGRFLGKILGAEIPNVLER
jgi:hypothetical protein